MKDVGYRAEQAWGMEVKELRKKPQTHRGDNSRVLLQAKATRVSHRLELVCPLMTKAALPTSDCG